MYPTNECAIQEAVSLTGCREFPHPSLLFVDPTNECANDNPRPGRRMCRSALLNSCTTEFLPADLPSEPNFAQLAAAEGLSEGTVAAAEYVGAFLSGSFFCSHTRLAPEPLYRSPLSAFVSVSDALLALAPL